MSRVNRTPGSASAVVWVCADAGRPIMTTAATTTGIAIRLMGCPPESGSMVYLSALKSLPREKTILMRKPNARVSLFFTIVVLGLLPRVAQGQPPPAGPPPVREGSAEFAFVGTSGNASTQSLGLGG